MDAPAPFFNGQNDQKCFTTGEIKMNEIQVLKSGEYYAPRMGPIETWKQIIIPFEGQIIECWKVNEFLGHAEIDYDWIQINSPSQKVLDEMEWNELEDDEKVVSFDSLRSHRRTKRDFKELMTELLDKGKVSI